MEQQLDATYLRAGVFERAAAVGLATIGLGIGILLGAWGISMLWRHVPPEISVQVKIPDVHITQDKPLVAELRVQDQPLVVDQSKPSSSAPISGPKNTVEHSTIIPDSNNKGKPDVDVIRREVTIFFSVVHADGEVVTGWNYRDGSGGVPVRQYCYYLFRNAGHASTKIDMAFDGARLPDINNNLVPDLDEALTKCQWRSI
jgi:hypothetical protein